VVRAGLAVALDDTEYRFFVVPGALAPRIVLPTDIGFIGFHRPLGDHPKPAIEGHFKTGQR